MHVIFVEPRFPANQQEFVRALHAVGARVTGIGEAPVEALGPVLRGRLHAYEQVRSVVDEEALLAAVRRVQAREWVDRMEATVEAHILPAARVRAAATIPGTSVETAFLCRDKPAMKEALRKAGIATAASTGASTPDEVRAFARRIGYPVILKPAASAGAAGTFKVTDDAGLEAAIRESGVGRGPAVAVEEFVEGHEGFYDTLSIDGRPVHDFASHYYPGVLEAMRTRWISPQVITTNRIGALGYDEVKALGRRVIEVLGIGTSATHMEVFSGPKGLRFSEIGCRPPGVGVWDLYCAANEFDLYREWAMAVAHGRPDRPPSRRYSAGMIALRPDRDGRIAGYEGAESIMNRYNEFVIDAHLPPPGTPTQPVEAGFMANAWVRMRHPDYDALREILDDVGRTLKVRATA
ncbi:MAG: ATP-grasp domain-containing protein, partial [Planctomycetaceae bacterium]|nr:ATP-grasp domain-containing protein [Planctomycetota bacterium]NUN51439.1 ATP-grasp domain-containing protein [Planctomycetaceae bacterium]